jgi:uncharacterized protein
MGKLLVVFGSTGNTGRHVVRLALERGLRVRAFARSPDKIPAELRSNPNLEVVKGDLSDADAIDRAVAGADYVVCTTGDAKASQAALVMSPFVRKLVASMRKHGVRRLLYQAGAFSPAPDQPSPIFIRVMRVLLAPLLGISGMLRDNDEIMKFLTAEAKDLEWTVTRPGMIKDAATKGAIKPADRPGPAVTYADVAAFNLDRVLSDAPPRQCPYLTY